MRSENMVGALAQQRTQVDVASLGDAELWVAVAGLAAFRTQAEITTHIATSLEALLAAQRQYVGQRRELSNAVDLEQRLGLVNVLGGDLAERKRASRPGIGEDDVEGSALGLHRRVESVEVGQIGDRALHRAGIGPRVATAASSSACRRPKMNTKAPSSMKRFAAARPIPVAPPVMTATFPSSFPIITPSATCVAFGTVE